MRLKATDFYSYNRPSRCWLRVYLRARGVPESPLSPYQEVIRRLGLEHEKRHLETFESFLDLGVGSVEARIQRTTKEVAKGSPVIYQGAFMATTRLDGVNCEVHGHPDFLIRRNNNYVIRDSKISRRITERDHPEILRQLETYGWLYEQTFGRPPAALQVHSGTGEIINIPYDGGQLALAMLGEIVAMRNANSQPYSPVGRTKCGACGYQGRCWSEAEERRDVALVEGVDVGLAVTLHGEGTSTVDDLLAHYDEDDLAEVLRPWGPGLKRVGRKSKRILLMAEALNSQQEFLVQPPAIPEVGNYVMFDLEGLPPQLDDLDKVFLWGCQVFGERPSDFKYALAAFGDRGDRQAWEDFLRLADHILQQYGDIPFVHWHHYERVKLETYVARYGDRDGIAHRVRDNLLDLLPITRRSVALPLQSYSLKVVEKYVGFKRTQDEYGGDWAMARYIEATETEDETLRREVIDQILKYNEEDLKATWAVLQWLKAKT